MKKLIYLLLALVLMSCHELEEPKKLYFEVTMEQVSRYTKQTTPVNYFEELDTIHRVFVDSAYSYSEIRAVKVDTIINYSYVYVTIPESKWCGWQVHWIKYKYTIKQL